MWKLKDLRKVMVLLHDEMDSCDEDHHTDSDELKSPSVHSVIVYTQMIEEMVQHIEKGKKQLTCLGRRDHVMI